MIRVFLSIFFGTLIACQPTNSPKATVVFQTNVGGFSSGSGMETFEGSHYAVGDDSPLLVQLDVDGKVMQKWSIWTDEYVVDNRMLSKQKPDFEALAISEVDNQPNVFIFGSGSKSPKRDFILYGSLDSPDSLRTHVGSPFYQYIKEQAGLSKKDFNLEGATFYQEKLILLNRGSNELYLLSKSGFLEYLKNGTIENLNFEKYDFDLPKIEGQKATFSGASIIPGSSRLLFTASVEAAEDWTGDGDILGSFVGMIDMNDLSNNVPVCLHVQLPDEQPFYGKLEAIGLMEGYSQKMKILSISDDDDGTTSFFHIEIEWLTL